LVSFADIGNMTLKEIDRLMHVLMQKKKQGHFKGFWSSKLESEQMMLSNEVVLQSIWSPAVTDLYMQGRPIIEASPVEGYRAWHGGMCLSTCARGIVKDAAYEYMNWWLSGWAGAQMAKQGYYMSVPRLVRHHLSADEWGYWYEGQIANTAIHGPDGQVCVPAGSVRSGGSYWRRMGNVAIWNTIMDEHNYIVRSWNELLAT
jgi:putative spermidine/putrescine transport system substrate-binding protein